MRIKVDWRSSSKENYNNFCKKNPGIKLTFDEWRNILYSYNEYFKNYILETGEKAKLPYGFGEFSINKKKRKRIKDKDGKEIKLDLAAAGNKGIASPGTIWQVATKAGNSANFVTGTGE